MQENYLAVDYKQINPTKYSVSNLSKDAKWLVFSDHYNKNWQVNDSLNLPFYSMINGFHVRNSSSDFFINFKPQEDVKMGIVLSLTTLFLISNFVIFNKRRHDGKK